MLSTARGFRRLLREPALRFALLGAALFTLHQLARRADRTIVIDRAALGAGRDAEDDVVPGPLQDRIARAIDDEVLFREARARGLDRDDQIVRRRLVQKLEFLTEDAADPAPPDDAALEAFRSSHAQLFTLPATIDFSHVFLSRARRGAHLDGDARALLSQLSADTAPAGLGDPFLAGDRFVAQSAQRLDSVFGRDFSRAAFALEPHTWRGPVSSTFGLHLVRIEERHEATLPPLARIRDRVLAAWLAEHRAQQAASARAALRAKYRIRIDPSLLGPAAEARAEQP